MDGPLLIGRFGLLALGAGLFGSALAVEQAFALALLATVAQLGLLDPGR